MTKRYCIIGATSAIAEAVTLECPQASQFLLVARDAEKLNRVKARLEEKGSTVHILVMDVCDDGAGEAIVRSIRTTLESVDVVLVAHGLLGEEIGVSLPDARTIHTLLQTNFTSAVLVITEVARFLRDQGYGTIAAISSVAGDRGRAKMLYYGSAKGGLRLFLQGLRQYLQPYGVHVLTILPGFVDTPMTAHLQKGSLFVSPKRIAQDIHKALRKKKNTVYTPWFWGWIMLCIACIPESVFKRMKF